MILKYFHLAKRTYFYYPMDTITQAIFLAVYLTENTTLEELRKGRGWEKDQEANIY